MTAELRLERVTTQRQRNDFYRVRRELYRDDPHAVVTLQSLEWMQLDTQRHPFYQHARREIWVAYRGSQPVGRIVAIVDDLHNSHYGDRVGFFGFFESIDQPEVARLLLDTAADWLRQAGCDTMRGPMSPSMKGEFGVLVDGFDHPPFIMMAHSPPYYDQLLQDYGCQPVKRFYSFLNLTEADNQAAQERFSKLGAVCDRVKARFPELEIRCATQETLEPMLREINRIGNVIRSRGWGFVPMTDAELKFQVAQLRRIIDPKTVIGAWMGDQMIGYNISIPNINWAIKKCWGQSDWLRLPQLLYWSRRIPQVRLIALGVDPEIRAKGVAALVTHSMTQLWNDFQSWEFGWIDEDNLPSMSALERALPLNRYKTYQVYERGL